MFLGTGAAASGPVADLGYFGGENRHRLLVKVSFYISKYRCNGMVVEESAMRGHHPVKGLSIYCDISLKPVEDNLYEPVVIALHPIGTDKRRVPAIVTHPVPLVTAHTVRTI